MRTLYFLFAALLCYVGFTETAESIPAFARKYRMSCMTCHSPIPRLKAYGDDFAGAGFRLADQDAPRYYVDAGDEELSLIRDFPLGVRFDAFATYNVADEKQAETDLPYYFKLLSGGEISEHLSYYMYFLLSERGETVGLEDCYIMYNDLFGVDFDIYFGQFQVSDPLFKRELRLTLEDYETYTTTPGLSDINMKYDRGLMLTYGFDWGTDIIFEVVNGCGLREADGMKLFDKDEYKNFFGRISQDIGDFLRVGAFAYSGKEEIKNGADSVLTNEAMIWGPDLTLAFGDKLELNLQYTQRTDDKIFVTKADAEATEDLETKGALAELIFTPNGDQSKWYAVGLFNWVESDLDMMNYKTASLHLGYLMRRNIRAVVEGTYNFSSENENFAKFNIGFVTAF